jgi:drug/metabolite transporter (DMT)-like permease
VLASLMRPGPRRGLILTVAGAVLISLEGLLIRLVQTDLWTVVWWRGWLLCYALAIPATLMFRRAHLGMMASWGGLLAVAAFAAAVFCFVSAIQQTTVANTLVIASGTPLAAALLGWLLLGERPAPATWLAVIGVFVGLAVIFSTSLRSGNPAGDLFALGYAACAAGYYVSLRRCPEDGFLLLMLLGGALSGALAWPQAAPLAVTSADLGWLLLLGLVVVPAGTLLLSYGTRDLSAAEVTLLMMLETVLGPLWVWLAVGEIPALATLAGGALVMLVVVAHSRRTARTSAA